MSVEVVKNQKGEWCVAVPTGACDYSTTPTGRVLRRIPISKDAPKDRAQFVAESMGMLKKG